jgi:hypothetical protein
MIEKMTRILLTLLYRLTDRLERFRHERGLQTVRTYFDESHFANERYEWHRR